MSGIGEAAAIIGITTFSIQSIKDLYNLIQDLRDIDKLKRVQDEIINLQTQVSGLSFLEKADNQTIEEIKTTGVTQAVNSCGSACETFQKQLERWIKHGPESWRDRIRVKRNQAKIDSLASQMWTAARLLESAVGIATLKLVSNQADRSSELAKLIQKVQTWQAITTDQRAQVSAESESLLQAGNDEADAVAEEMERRVTTLDAFSRSCDKTVEQLQAIKLNQSITNVWTAKNATASVGMPAASVDKVERQVIDNIQTDEYGKSQIGIW